LPGIILSVALTLVVTAALPAPVGELVLVAHVLLVVVLASGRLEAPSVLVLGGARRTTVGEERLLAPITQQLHNHGFGAPHLVVFRGDLRRAAAEPRGRRSVAVAPRLLRWLHRQQVSTDVAAAILAQAAAGLQAGPARFDLAVRLLTAPGALVLAMFQRIAASFTRVPGALGLWRVRAVFGAVAVVQCLQQQQATVAVTTGALVAVSYSSPACARAWRRRVEVAADRLVATAGLGEQLAFAVRSADEPGCVGRVHRILAAAPTSVQEPGCPGAGGRRRTLHLVR